MKNVNFISAETYEEMSRIAAAAMLDCVKLTPNALFCLPTGSSPTAMYKNFVQGVQIDGIDVSKMRVVKLDEWLGVSLTDPSTCESYLQEHIIEPLGIDNLRYLAFDSNPDDPIKECRHISKTLAEWGQIDLCILGLGKNGHLGLNEPGEFIRPDSHVVTLDAKTKNHTMLSKTAVPVQFGITLGIGQLLLAKQILFLVSGEGKEEAFEAFKKAEVSASLPASFLWLHENVTCIYIQSN